jgi:hypothetical protein
MPLMFAPTIGAAGGLLVHAGAMSGLPVELRMHDRDRPQTLRCRAVHAV